MRKNFIFFMSLTLIFMLQSLTADTVNVTGKWEMTIQSPRGERTRAVEFVQDGEKLKVTMQGRQDNTIEGKGTVKDNKIEWTITRETPRGEFTITYKGTITGDSIKGEAVTGFGTMNWSAARKKEKD